MDVTGRYQTGRRLERLGDSERYRNLDKQSREEVLSLKYQGYRGPA